MSALFHSPAFAIGATLLAYALADKLYRRTQRIVLNPVLVSILALCGLLPAIGLPYASYAAGTEVISWFLGPAVVALGASLYEQRPALARLGRGLIVSITVGSAAGITTAVITAKLLGASGPTLATLAPKSVTTPIAMAIADKVGGIPALVAVIVILVGVFGAIVGPPLLRAARITSPTAYGLAMGAAAHGVGTARAFEDGEAQGASSALAICLNGLATALLVPPLLRLLG